MGPSTNPSQVPVGNGDANAPGGTTMEVVFHKPLEPIKASEVKKMLAAVLDFDQHSATEIIRRYAAAGDEEGHSGEARHRGHDARSGGAGDGPAGV